VSTTPTKTEVIEVLLIEVCSRDRFYT